MDPLKESELEALVSLLEDEDQEVMQHVEEKILSLGGQVIPFLETRWEQSFNPDYQRKIEDLIHSLQFEILKQNLRNWKENRQEDLLEGLWLVATYQYPDLPLDEVKKLLEQIFYEVWVDFEKELHPFDQVKRINGVLFGKLKLRANTKNFHSPANSMINRVMESRRGNPISLCSLYLLVAQKLELPVYGVNLPNLFILTYKNDQVQFYINAFNRGIIFSKADIDNYLDHLNMNRLDLFYQPCSNLDIVKRFLRNLAYSFEKLGKYSELDEIKTLMLEIGGENMSQ